MEDRYLFNLFGITQQRAEEIAMEMRQYIKEHQRDLNFNSYDLVRHAFLDLRSDGDRFAAVYLAGHFVGQADMKSALNDERSALVKYNEELLNSLNHFKKDFKDLETSTKDALTKYDKTFKNRKKCLKKLLATDEVFYDTNTKTFSQVRRIENGTYYCSHTPWYRDSKTSISEYPHDLKYINKHFRVINDITEFAEFHESNHSWRVKEQ